MHLSDVMGAAVAEGGDVEISALAYDNRAVAPGTLFVCVPGFTRLLEQAGNDLTRFYAAARELARQPRTLRHARLCTAPVGATG